MIKMDAIENKIKELQNQRRATEYKEKPKNKNFYVGVVKNTPYMPDLTMVTMMYASSVLGKIFNYITVTGSALTIARKRLLESLHNKMIEQGDDPRNTYVLFIDSDIIINNTPQELAEILKDAEEKEINIAGLYKKQNGESVIIQVGSNDLAPILLDTKSEDWNKYEKYIPTYKKWYYPLGFYYGKYIDFNYIFKMDLKGEDIYFVEDNDYMWSKTYIDKRINLGHNKNVTINSFP